MTERENESMDQYGETGENPVVLVERNRLTRAGKEYMDGKWQEFWNGNWQVDDPDILRRRMEEELGNVSDELKDSAKRSFQARLGRMEKQKLIERMEGSGSALERVWKEGAEVRQVSLSRMAGEILKLERQIRGVVGDYKDEEVADILPEERETVVRKSEEVVAQAMLGLVEKPDFGLKNVSEMAEFALAEKYKQTENLLERQQKEIWKEVLKKEKESNEALFVEAVQGLKQKEQKEPNWPEKVNDWLREKKREILLLSALAVGMLGLGVTQVVKAYEQQNQKGELQASTIVSSETTVQLMGGNLATETPGLKATETLQSTVAETLQPTALPEATKIPSAEKSLDLSKSFTMDWSDAFLKRIGCSRNECLPFDSDPMLIENLADNAIFIDNSGAKDSLLGTPAYKKSPEIAGIIGTQNPNWPVMQIHSGNPHVMFGTIENQSWRDKYVAANHDVKDTSIIEMNLPGQPFIDLSRTLKSEKTDVKQVDGSSIEVKVFDLENGTYYTSVSQDGAEKLMKVVDIRQVSYEDVPRFRGLSNNEPTYNLQAIGLTNWGKTGVTFSMCDGYNLLTGEFDERLFVSLEAVEPIEASENPNEQEQQSYIVGSAEYSNQEYNQEILPNMELAVENINEYFAANPISQKNPEFSFNEVNDYYEGGNWVSGKDFVSGTGACDIATLLLRAIRNYSEQIGDPMVTSQIKNGFDIEANSIFEIQKVDHADNNSYQGMPSDEVVVSAQGKRDAYEADLRISLRPDVPDDVKFWVVIEKDENGNFTAKLISNYSAGSQKN